MDQAIGAGIGAGIGLIALLLAALYNAHLQRRRDRTIRTEERNAMAAALFADFEGAIHVLDDLVMALADAGERPGGYDHAERLALPPLVCAAMVPDALQRLPHHAARLSVLALRSYEMSGMLLRLSAAELARGETGALAARSALLKGMIENLHTAMIELAPLAEAQDALRQIEKLFPTTLNPEGR